MTSARVLVVDDTKREFSRNFTLRMADVKFETAASGEEALQALVLSTYDVLIANLRIQDASASIISEIERRQPDLPVIVLGGPTADWHAHPRPEWKYVPGEPVDYDRLAAALRQAIVGGERKRQNDRQITVGERTDGENARTDLRRREMPKEDGLSASPLKWLNAPGRQMEKTIAHIRQVADCPLTILIQGETGTGKELVARAIHYLSARSRKPFIAVDCGAIPDTLIESELFGYEKGAFTGADQRKEGHFQLVKDGTLFLDEIANLPLPTQAKLLRVLQEHQTHPLGGKEPFQIRARIVAASNVPLEQEVRKGSFRLDLYHRLNEFEIVLPPLRERDNILELTYTFLAEASMEFGSPAREFSESAAEILLRYSWPGNVRELRNVVRRAVVLGPEVIGPEDLSIATSVVAAPSVAHRSRYAPGYSLKKIAEAATAHAEMQAVRQALQCTSGNVSRAARELQIDYKTLYVKMKRYGIRAAEFKSGNPALSSSCP